MKNERRKKHASRQGHRGIEVSRLLFANARTKKSMTTLEYSR